LCLGGLSNVIKSAEETGRLSDAILRYDPNPLQYNNLWIATAGGALHAIGMFGLNQVVVVLSHKRNYFQMALQRCKVFIGDLFSFDV
jgi:hypothetical protein